MPPGGEDNLSLSTMVLNVARSLSDHDAKLTERQLVKRERVGKGDGLPASIAGLA
jgi:hypothetical protein